MPFAAMAQDYPKADKVFGNNGDISGAASPQGVSAPVAVLDEKTVNA